MIVRTSKDHMKRDSGQWIFVDIGFSRKSKSCGIAIDDGAAKEVTFADLKSLIVDTIKNGAGPLNLLIEAPLSVAFNSKGNPTGRIIEKRKPESGSVQTRYWYVGLGCSVLVATMYLLRTVYDINTPRDIRLFEGLASFKDKEKMTSHAEDVDALRGVAWGRDCGAGSIVWSDKLIAEPGDRLESAFMVAEMDLGIPLVVVVGG